MKTTYRAINHIVYSFLLSGIIISCGPSDKKTRLEKLEQKQAEIKAEISQLESEIASERGPVETRKVKDIGMLPITLQVFKHFIEVQGRVDADQNVAVSSKMAGVLSRIPVNVGDEVREGQLLAELDNQVLIQSIEELKSQLAFANTIFDRQKALWDQKIGTEVQFLTAKNNKEALEKKLTTLNAQLDMSLINSPINGTVDAIDIKVGQSIMPGMPAVRVVNFNKLKIKAEVAETYSSKVKKGDDVIIFFPDLNKEVSSKISYAAKVINNTTRTFTAEANLITDRQEYRPNMIAVLRIIDYQNDSAIVIPVNLIQRTESSEFVYVVVDENGKKVARKKEIMEGQIYNGKAEVLSGLTVNDKLITAAYLDVTDGMIVKY